MIDCLIDIAKAEVGYLEKKSNGFLYEKTANAGSGNYTKYWAEIKPDYQGQPWCACFVTWCFVQAFGRENTEKLLGHFPFVYVPTIASLFEKHSLPQKGDIVCFYRNGTFVHTGIVISVSGDKFTTVEGNTSGGSTIIANGGGVCQKTYYNSKLPGTKFIRPNYATLEGKEMTAEERKKFDTLVNVVSDLSAKIDEIQKQNKVYHYFDELPDYARDVIKELYDKGIYRGASPSDLNLPDTLMRNLVINARAGLYR